MSITPVAVNTDKALSTQPKERMVTKGFLLVSLLPCLRFPQEASTSPMNSTCLCSLSSNIQPIMMAYTFLLDSFL